ncbi:PepSY domain-containing protein [Alkalicoccus daliensis]|uniref:Uncharacterized membrane protein YkoI n=1 Tax=Alkalicoccus daliensis TaxID=745820 RepID=A0A1H0ISV8_9BACI|nr:PepSY domain-containing protein [Alkalicoccus daliensis]SDO34452.1 Uncharacterized membrane protein YkoI [Alkalicoccus daliensis]
MRSGWRTGIGAIIFVVMIAALYFFFPDEQQEINAQEVSEMLEVRYQGKVEAVAEEAGDYLVEMSTEQGTYEIVVSGAGEVASFLQTESKSGEEGNEKPLKEEEILSVEQIKSMTSDTVSAEAEITSVQKKEEENRTYYNVEFMLGNQEGKLEIDAYSGSVDLYTLEEQKPPEPLSEQEATAIAKEQFNGQLDDIDKEEKNGRPVYEIELENEALDKEADIIIDAYSGEVISVEIDN